MSGDVQPRKRKDKKRKKDELGFEEPRGTAAALGEGDVFIHSHHDHGTGGHWCAKIIFFSLLAVLMTLIGLIILENRGLSELEANAVESKYSGVLEGWIEDTHDDDHHDEHTLELKHPDVEDHDDDDEDDHNDEDEHDDDEDDHDDEEDEHDDDEDDHDDEEDEHDDDEDHGDEDDDHQDEDDVDTHDEDNEETLDEDEGDSYDGDDDTANEKYDVESNNEGDDENIDNELGNEIDDQSDDEHENQDEEVEELAYRAYKNIYASKNVDDSGEDMEKEFDGENDQEDDENNDDEDNDDDINDDNDNNNDGNESNEDNDENELYEEKDEDEENENDDDDDDDEIIEKIEREVSDEEILSAEVANTNNDINDNSEEFAGNRGDIDEEQDEPAVEAITIPPAGKPYDEIEDEPLQSTPDTLAEEEEYERKQEELRKEREAQSSQGMWLKLVVGGALLVATHAVMRRATAPRDDPDTDEQLSREDPPVIDRRMTLIAQTNETPIVTSVQEEIVQKTVSVNDATPQIKSEPLGGNNKSDEVLEAEIKTYGKEKENDEEKELYSDEEEEEEEEEEEIDDEEEDIKQVIPKKVELKETKVAPVAKAVEVEPEEDSEDVEIIDEEEIEEEIEDEEDEVEEEISDVDDTELLSRLDAKYGRLPEPERPGANKGGEKSIDEDWPGEPSDPYWSQQLDLAEDEFRQGAWSACERRASAPELSGSARALWLAAAALDAMAEAKRDNRLLSRAIQAYLHLLKMNERLPDKKLLHVAQRAIERIQFRGTYLNAEPIYRLLIRRFPNDVNYRNNLTVCFLMANRADLADEILKETLKLWPNDRVALAHYGFVLKTQYNKLEESIIYLQKALEGDTGPANEPRFYYHLGDAFLLLKRFEEAHKVHERGAKLGHFLSPMQRSLYNVPRLKGKPWWPIDETPYAKLARSLEKSWREILKEGLAAKALYEKEKEGLKERGEWSQLDIFVRGREIPGRCKKAPVTCSIVKQEVAASGCRRGQIKFSLIEPGTHVRPHVGPTNCRLRMHLGLSNTKDTYIRVDKETRQWEVGKVFIFDDSFEHEVWHNGTGARLVLIVDVWHPELSAAERRSLPAI